MTGLQGQARAVGDRTRYAIFSDVADAGRPVDVAELVSHDPREANCCLGLHQEPLADV